MSEAKETSAFEMVPLLDYSRIVWQKVYEGEYRIRPYKKIIL